MNFLFFSFYGLLPLFLAFCASTVGVIAVPLQSPHSQMPLSLRIILSFFARTAALYPNHETLFFLTTAVSDSVLFNSSTS